MVEEERHCFPRAIILSAAKDPAQQAASSRAGSFVISFLRMTWWEKRLAASRVLSS